jgi:signal transduction histidine kinase
MILPTEILAETALHLICAAAGLSILGLAIDRGRFSSADKYRRVAIAAGLVVMGRVAGLAALALGVQQMLGIQEWVLETLSLAALFWAFLYIDLETPRWASGFLIAMPLLLAAFFVIYLLTVGRVQPRTWSVMLWLTTLLLNSLIYLKLLRRRPRFSLWLRGAFLLGSLAAAAGLLGYLWAAMFAHAAALVLFAMDIFAVTPMGRGRQPPDVFEAPARTVPMMQRAAFLLEVGRAISSSLSLPVVLERVSESTARAIAADWAYIMLPEDGNAERLVMVARYGWWGRRWKTESQPRRQLCVSLHKFSLLRHSFVRQRQVLANNPDDYEQLALIHDRLSRPPAGPILIQPLHVGERSLGTLLLGRIAVASQQSGNGSRGFSASDAELCRALASQAASAIGNALTYENLRKEALRLTDRLEQSLGHLGRHQAILETLAEGIAIRGPARRVKEINRAAKDILGVQGEPMLSEALESLFERLHGTAGWQDRDRVRLKWRGKDVAGTMTPLKTPEGVFLGDALLLRDVTREQQIETAVQQQIGRISHRIEAALASITGHIDLLALEAKGDATEGWHSLAALRAASESMAGLIADLLLMAETQWGEIKLAPQLVDARRIIEASVQAASSQAEAKHLELGLELSPDVGFVSCDPRRLRQIVDKVLASALYYATAGGRITVEASAIVLQDNDGSLRDHLVIKVHDTGIYVTRDESVEGFDASHRIMNLDSPKAGRTGLGLVAAKKLVEAHGGSIWVEGRTGGGCTLSFAIPAEGTTESRRTRPNSSSPAR